MSRLNGIKCDHCEHFHHFEVTLNERYNYHLPVGWITAFQGNPRQDTNESHFCSFACLGLWASKQAESNRAE